jgi:hypothetical protein
VSGKIINRGGDEAVVRSRQVEFDKAYGFMIAGAALLSRSSNPDERHVGEQLHAFLCEKRLAARKRVTS